MSTDTKPADSKDPIILPADEQAIIDQLVEWQRISKNAKNAAMSDGEFAPLINMTGTMWNLTRNGKYAAMVKPGTWHAHVGALRGALNKLKNKKRMNGRFDGKTFHAFTSFQAVFTAVEECIEKPFSDIRRFVVFLAKTGGGKSFLADQCIAKFNATAVMARRSWVTNKFIALKDICNAYGINISSLQSPAQLEDALVEHFSKQEKPVLVIDEGEYFGKDILDSVKFLINSTRITIVCLAIPEAYDKWNKAWPMEAGQIRRRTHTIIADYIIDETMAAKMISVLPLDGDKEAMAEEMAKQANTFGALDLIAQVVTRLKENKRVTKALLDKTIETVHAEMGQGRIGGAN